MKKMLDNIHDTNERALYTSCALGIHLNSENESYGGTLSIRCMKGGDIILHSTIDDVVTFLSGLHKKINSILGLLSADNINHQDYEQAIKSIGETVGAKKNIEIYQYWIYKNKSLVRELNQ